MRDRIDNDFKYHAPNEDKVPRHEAVRDAAKLLALRIMALCPDCRERSIAITKSEEAMMWANAAIARNE